MARFFLEPELWGESAELLGDEAVHCARVLRAKEGDRIEVFDGKGRTARATVRSVSRQSVRLRLEEVHTDPDPKVRVVLIQAVLKGKAMDWLIQKAVELGVSEIRPVTTEHAVVRPGDAKAEKWRRAGLEACKQCGQNRLPIIHDPIPLNELLAEPCDGVRIVAALCKPRVPLRECLNGKPDKIEFLVGPEGDFSSAEMASAVSSGFIPADLGPRVLRSETAALFGLAAFAYAFA